MRITIDIADDWLDRWQAELAATEAGEGSNDDEHDLLSEIAEEVLIAVAS